MRYCTSNLRQIALLALLLPRVLMAAQTARPELRRIEDGLTTAAQADQLVLVLLLDPASPLMQELASEEARKAFASRIVVRLDAVADPTAADRYMVRELPAALLLDANGQVRARKEGLRSLADVRGLLPAGSPQPAGDTGVAELLGALGTEKFPTDGWQRLALAVGNDRAREAVRETTLARTPFPRQELVALLSSPLLAVRSGALDLLEEAAGDDFGFDPWQQEDANASALRLWREWAGKTEEAQRFSALDDALIGRLLGDVLTGERGKADRSRERLVRAGASTLAAIARYLKEHPALEPAYLLRLRELRYSTLLARCPGIDGARVARQIVFGNVDRQLEAIRSLHVAKTQALPILRELLEAKDSLVRETAADAIGAIGANHAVALLADHARSERDVDVLVTIANRLGKIRTKRSHATLCELARHEEEDVVTAALLALCRFKRLLPLPADVADRIDDPRWRVRTAALRTVADCGNTNQKSGVLRRLSDEDPFVRNTAATLLPEAIDREQLDKVRELFRTREDLRPPLLAAFAALRAPPDDEMLQIVETKTSPPILLRLLAVWEETVAEMSGYGAMGGEELPKEQRRALSQGRQKCLALIGRLTQHSDPSVRRAAADVLSTVLTDEEEPAREFADPLLSLSPALQAHALARSETLSHTRKDLVHWRRQQRIEGTAADGPDPLRELTEAFLGAPPAATTVADLRRAFLGGLIGKEAAEAAEQHGIPLRVRMYESVVESFDKLPADSEEKLEAALLLVCCGNGAGLPILDAGFDRLDEDQLDELAVLPRVLPPTEVSHRLVDKLLASAGEYAARGLAVSLTEAAVRRPGWDAVLLAAVHQPASTLSLDGIVDAWEKLTRSPDPKTRTKVRWLAENLLKENSRPAARAAGMYLLAQTGTQEAVLATSEKLRQDPDAYVRRAAWQALLACQPEQFVKDVQTVIGDPSPAVRSLAVSKEREAGRGLMLGERQSNYVSWRSMGTEEVAIPLPALRQLSGDADPAIRVGAMLTLDRRGEPPAPDQLLAALQAMARQVNASPGEFVRHLLGWDLEEARKLSPQTLQAVLDLGEQELPEKVVTALRFLIEKQGKASESEMERRLSSYLWGDDDEEEEKLIDDPVPTPAAAIGDIHARPTTPTPQVGGDDAVAALPETKGCKVILFYKPGCRECREAAAILDQVQAQIAGVTVERWNIHQPEAMRRNEALCTRLGVEERLHLVAPAIVGAGGALVNREITLDRAVRLVLASREAETPGWDAIPEPEMEQSEVAMRERFAVITIGIVTLSGLLDGVNPCAFATVVFLLSYLQLRGHRRRHLWQAGTGFIAGVFVTYYLLGLGLAEVVERLSGLVLAGQILRWSLVGMLAVLALLNLRDGILCLRGRMGDMLLQLPSALKRGIHGTVRRGVRMTWLLPAAFAMGALISLLELACTGQVYAPTILYILRSGLDPWRAAWLLGLYNLAFIVPLVVVFAAALFGVGNASFRNWLERHAATVKFATALLFAAMLLLMLR